ncbi:hypothetical protein [Sphingomonas nostoxanthinifaciens]|uniref:hypothetical protein n=1 Tax=Sphingomonas nostoxanthinifaciens TaxID=2872652 RepID=UPI001CC1FC7B|nr:hypothetical protein [Sphingomonas nostoxanthinifaciens]
MFKRLCDGSALPLLLSLGMGMPAVSQTPGTTPAPQYNVPPPPGYQTGSARYVQSERDRVEDDGYAAAAERWASANCIAERKDNATAGAVIGGLIGALAGTGLAGGHDQLPAAVLGAGAGAAAGSTIARNTSPGCPPGYLVRPAPQPFYPASPPPSVVYVAPSWYDPWIWYGGHWLYRPYPYHRFWFDHHWRHP